MEAVKVLKLGLVPNDFVSGKMSLDGSAKKPILYVMVSVRDETLQPVAPLLSDGFVVASRNPRGRWN